jgi:hypothetical protein
VSLSEHAGPRAFGIVVHDQVKAVRELEDQAPEIEASRHRETPEYQPVREQAGKLVPGSLRAPVHSFHTAFQKVTSGKGGADVAFVSSPVDAAVSLTISGDPDFRGWTTRAIVCF